jgi:hypothetical protein
VATEAAWLNGNNLKKKKTKKKKDKMKESLDTHRPSHGRTSSLNGNLHAWDCPNGRATPHYAAAFSRSVKKRPKQPELEC